MLTQRDRSDHSSYAHVGAGLRGITSRDRCLFLQELFGEAHNLFRNDGLCLEFNVIPKTWYPHVTTFFNWPSCPDMRSGVQWQA